MYCRKEMVKILDCYLIPKKVMALCLRVQYFLANPVYSRLLLRATITFSKRNRLGSREVLTTFIFRCHGRSTSLARVDKIYHSIDKSVACIRGESLTKV